MDRFEAMHVFVRVVEAGSLSAAARAIPMSLTSVSRHLSTLERQFGMPLLRRTTRRIALTDEGRLFFQRAKSILADFDEMSTLIGAGCSEPAGRLRIATPSLLGRLLIAPLLPRFLARYPHVSVEMMLIDRSVNLMEEDIHVAIRMGRLPDSTLIARKLGNVGMVVCAAPSYLQRHGVPGSPNALSQHDCLVFSDRPGPIDWHFRRADTRHSARVAGRLWANSLDVLVAAALEGAGIVRAPSWQVAQLVEQGRLQRILADYEPHPAAINAIYERARRTSLVVHAFLDCVAESGAVGGLAKALPD
ncbi:MAG: LysR family transcriptional regulator [Candidimonas sp.]|nr:MAG: LysR family transcriptional regulator [Candidimonas sp.]